MTVRIDTLRNQLGATATLLTTTSPLLTELHALAYERHRGPQGETVRGGARDYALDNHGNPDARAAYQALGETIDHTCTTLALALHDASKPLREGGNRGNQSRRLISVGDLGIALAAQARRIGRGEGLAPHLPQPERDQAMKIMEQRAVKAERERDRAVTKLRKLEAEALAERGDGAWPRPLTG
jgi:hypothetical protein